MNYRNIPIPNYHSADFRLPLSPFRSINFLIYDRKEMEMYYIFSAGSSTATFPMNIDSTSAIPVDMNYGNTSSPAGYTGYVNVPSTVDEERVRQIVRAQLSQHSDQMGREFDTLIASSSINENTSPEELCAQNPDAYRAMLDRLTANFQTNLQLSQTAPHSTTFTGASTTSSFSMGSNSGHAGHGRSETRGNNRSYGSGRNTRPPGGGFEFE